MDAFAPRVRHAAAGREHGRAPGRRRSGVGRGQPGAGGRTAASRAAAEHARRLLDGPEGGLGHFFSGGQQVSSDRSELRRRSRSHLARRAAVALGQPVAAVDAALVAAAAHVGAVVKLAAASDGGGDRGRVGGAVLRAVDVLACVAGQ